MGLLCCTIAVLQRRELLMAIKTVTKGAPAKQLITPIPKPVSRGVVEMGERARLLQRSRPIVVPKKEKNNGYGTGTSVAGATPVNGASV